MGHNSRALNHYGGAETLRGASNDLAGCRKVPTMSQIHSSIQYICFRTSSGSNMRAPNLLRALGPIQPCHAPGYFTSNVAEIVEINMTFIY